MSELEAFVEAHRGLRFGRLFGRPAGYAGRRLFACVVDEGMAARLPATAAEAARRAGGRPWAARRRGWILFPPRAARDRARVWPLLEVAARHAAEGAPS